MSLKVWNLPFNFYFYWEWMDESIYFFTLLKLWGVFKCSDACLFWKHLLPLVSIFYAGSIKSVSFVVWEWILSYKTSLNFVMWTFLAYLIKLYKCWYGPYLMFIKIVIDVLFSWEHPHAALHAYNIRNCILMLHSFTTVDMAPICLSYRNIFPLPTCCYV
jgi:hypothetical protein